MFFKKYSVAILLAALTFYSSGAFAADEVVAAIAATTTVAPVDAPPAVSGEVAYIFNTLLFLVMGFLVMFMAAGFAMLEAGMVRSTSVTTILIKNISLYSLAGIMFYLVGYRLMYDGVDGGFMGTFGLWLADDAAAGKADFSGNYAAGSDWFFQMVFGRHGCICGVWHNS